MVREGEKRNAAHGACWWDTQCSDARDLTYMLHPLQAYKDAESAQVPVLGKTSAQSFIAGTGCFTYNVFLKSLPFHFVPTLQLVSVLR